MKTSCAHSGVSRILHGVAIMARGPELMIRNLNATRNLVVVTK
jgi:hypothetical protein